MTCRLLRVFHVITVPFCAVMMMVTMVILMVMAIAIKVALVMKFND